MTRCDHGALCPGHASPSDRPCCYGQDCDHTASPPLTAKARLVALIEKATPYATLPHDHSCTVYYVTEDDIPRRIAVPVIVAEALRADERQRLAKMLRDHAKKFQGWPGGELRQWLNAADTVERGEP